MTTGEVIALIKALSGGGSGGGVLVVTDTDGTLDKTWQEIHDADFAVVISAYPGGRFFDFVADIGHTEDNTDFYISVQNEHYSASSASGYPTTSN